MICCLCHEKTDKKLMEQETRTCYRCLANLEERIEEFNFISNYESN